ncbi:glycosyltransferase family 4 protein [Acinetobacter sp. ANC 5584]
MNIALFSRVLFLSGVTTHIIDLSSELIKSGHSVYIFTAGPQMPKNEANIRLETKLKDTGAIIIHIPFPLSAENKFYYIASMFQSISSVAYQLKLNNIDIIHVHTPVLSFIPLILRKKFVKTIHTINLSLSIFDRKANHEIVISKETYKEAKLKFGYKNDELTLIFNGVNESFASTINAEQKNVIKKDKDVPLGKIIIGIVASVQYNKGHDILLEAISLLDNHLKEKVHVVILGEGNQEQEEWLKFLIGKFDLEEKVSKFGFQEPKPFYDIMDIFVLPSRLEGFGLVVVEAMLSNCSVIRSNTEGAYDQIKHNETGLLFDNENVLDLVQQLEYLIKEDNRRIEISQAGKAYALANFTASNMAKKTLEVYSKVLSQ